MALSPGLLVRNSSSDLISQHKQCPQQHDKKQKGSQYKSPILPGLNYTWSWEHGLQNKVPLQKEVHTGCHMVIDSVRLIKQVLLQLKPWAYLLPDPIKHSWQFGF